MPKTMSFRKILFSVYFACFFFNQSWGAEFGWEVRLIDDTKYLSLLQIETFFGFDERSNDGNRIIVSNDKVEMDLQVESFQCVMNGVKFRFENKIERVGEDVFVSALDLLTLDAVLRPNFIRGAVVPTAVILDPAHGGNFKGVENEFGTEADYALKYAKLMKTKLVEKGIDVIMTREDDQTLTLQERVKIANAFEGDAVFIRIGFRSGPKDRSGIGTVVLSENRKEGINYRPMAMALAAGAHGAVSRRVEAIPDDGIRSVESSALSDVEHPAILLECGYMTNKLDARYIDSESYQEALADAIKDSLLRYKYAIRQGINVKEADE